MQPWPFLVIVNLCPTRSIQCQDSGIESEIRRVPNSIRRRATAWPILDAGSIFCGFFLFERIKDLSGHRENSREDESVAIDETRVFGVEGHEFVEEDVGHRRHTYMVEVRTA